MKLRSLIGTRAFYKMALAVAVPIMIQNGITNFVSLLDNIMVGQVGTDQMSGVSIANQLMFVFNLCIFGGVGGAGIFAAQFYGSGNTEGVRNAFRFKLLVAAGVLLLSSAVFILWDEPLIQAFLHEGSETGDLDATLHYGREYLHIMLLGLPAFALTQCYASTLRETGETMLPMTSGIIAVFVNLFFNYLLIYGKLGLPAMGASGAAIATVISRYVECCITIVWTHRHAEKAQFIRGAWRSFRMPASLALDIAKKGLPLLVNEFLWSAGMALLAQCYSTRGLATVAAINITSTISNLFNICFMAMGNAVSIIVGQQLGAGRLEEAKKTDAQLIAFSVATCALFGTLLAVCAPFFPKIYNTTEEVRSIATSLIWVVAGLMPFQAFTHSAYFTLRSGGKTMITFLFDSVFVCVVMLPLAWCLSRLTNISIVPMYLLCQGTEIIKCVIGYIMLKKGVWVQNVVSNA